MGEGNVKNEDVEERGNYRKEKRIELGKDNLNL